MLLEPPTSNRSRATETRFHIAFVAPDPVRQGTAWDVWYKFMTENHGLAKKAAFIGMSKGGSIATAGGVVFIAAAADGKFRAFESRTGKELWVTKLDSVGNATPITYRGRNGKQYVVIVAGGPGHLRGSPIPPSDVVIAFALP